MVRDLKDTLYIFLDESGDFDFSTKGSKYYIFSCVVKGRPFMISSELEKLKFDLLEYGGYNSLTHFHANDNNKYVREKVYEVLVANSHQYVIYSNIIQKNKTNPSIRGGIKFYSKMLGYLIRYVIKQQLILGNYSDIIIITDRVPTSQNKTLMEKSIKAVLNDMLSKTIKYKILHHPCMSNYGLQISDYCCYALGRKYERNDLTYYNLIKSKISSEYDFFKNGMTTYY